MLNEDGLVDIALGVGLLSAALYQGLDPALHVRLAGLAVLVPLLIVLVIGATRRRLVYPRIGKTRLPAIGAVPGLSVILTVLFFAGLMAFLVFERPGRCATPGGLIWLLRGLLLATAATLVAVGLRTGLARFYVHAGVIALSLFVAGLLFGASRAAAILMVGVPGAVLLITGVIVFARFLRKYPVLT
ncbi:MAG TPA: hypothetical protein VMH22_15335 [bacterium]|nr:hypothetical protein [bacterium]